MEITQVFTTLLVVACGALGWFGRTIFSETRSLRNDITDVKVLLSAEYIKHDRFQKALDPLILAVDELRKELYNKK